MVPASTQPVAVSTPSAVETTAVTEDPTVTVIADESAGNGTENVDFDFVNLPGYGVIDDLNSTANASQFSCYHRRYGYYADVVSNKYDVI